MRKSIESTGIKKRAWFNPQVALRIGSATYFRADESFTVNSWRAPCAHEVLMKRCCSDSVSCERLIQSCRLSSRRSMVLPLSTFFEPIHALPLFFDCDFDIGFFDPAYRGLCASRTDRSTGESACPQRLQPSAAVARRIRKRVLQRRGRHLFGRWGIARRSRSQRIETGKDARETLPRTPSPMDR